MGARQLNDGVTGGLAQLPEQGLRVLHTIKKKEQIRMEINVALFNEKS
jgi:hypothetical protein